MEPSSSLRLSRTPQRLALVVPAAKSKAQEAAKSKAQEFVPQPTHERP
jgi:hypothetical protein